MKKSVSIFTMLFLLVITLVACSEQEVKEEKVELRISAAASLQDALRDIQAVFEKENPEMNITYNFAGSGVLQQQIMQGAPVDLFLSSSEDKFESLITAEMIADGEHINLLENELVLIAPSPNETNKISGFEDLMNGTIDKIAIGIPESVPAGKYAKETLEVLEIWDEVESKLILAKDVRQVLSYVETGNVDAGIVYKTDALVSDNSRIISTANKEHHTPIMYPLGILNDTKFPVEAKRYYDFLQSKEATAIFEEYGFIVN
ncbi:molybdate ABC transporter substrate-binding protein [Pradoshia sp. D12]|uniref:molybdate ABC transporter substrate-binding protein n=1 Tax=Bacillaceae TaxID=186817 RepID=UPI0011205A29|nr:MULTISPECIES: molybdate ABC transporter substrate-binding protein [Bacillaceae]QFK71851.1 molybdate ABC transporter substrate-binding protein [Pradoshia sp. D12]TPF73646.1 molybdate ABC transporter substrate-binding protein [Bacillus sp. D12]